MRQVVCPCQQTGSEHCAVRYVVDVILNLDRLAYGVRITLYRFWLLVYGNPVWDNPFADWLVRLDTSGGVIVQRIDQLEKVPTVHDYYHVECQLEKAVYLGLYQSVIHKNPRKQKPVSPVKRVVTVDMDLVLPRDEQGDFDLACDVQWSQLNVREFVLELLTWGSLNLGDNLYLEGVRGKY